MLNFITNNSTWILIGLLVLVIIFAIMIMISRKEETEETHSTYVDYQANMNHETKHEDIDLKEVKEEKEPKPQEAVRMEPVEPMVEESDVEAVEMDESGLKIRYNYSFEARMHQAPLESQERFSELKNYLLSYEGVEVRKSWKYERFMYKGKPVLKAWIHGNNLKLYYNIEPKSLKDSKYSIQDVSYAKMHESTPSLFIVNGPRLLEYAKELVDMYLKDMTTQGVVPTTDYTVKYMKRSALVEMKLVKVNYAHGASMS